MAIFYVDPINGNDSNNGTSFALRKKTVSSAASASAAGDTIRVMKSPDPTSIGSATWTKGSNTVTLAAPLTADIETCESGWTISTNVTGTYTSSAKQGTNALQLAVATAFSNGVIAYKEFTAKDLSGYQQISLWVRQTSGTLATDGQIRIRLTPSGGFPASYTINVPAIPILNQWHAFTIDNGSAFTGTIERVEVYLNADQGAQTFLFDNIMACKAPSAEDSLSLTSLISKYNDGTEAYAPIRSISGTTVNLDAGVNTGISTVFVRYAGTTETVTSYKREPFYLTPEANLTTSAFFTVSNGGTGTPRTISGGWDTTDMSTQTGQTYYSGTNGQGRGMNIVVGNVNVERMNPSRFYIGAYIAALSSTNTSTALTLENVVGNSNIGVFVSGNTSALLPGYTANISNISFNGGGTGAVAYYETLTTNSSVTIGNITSNYTVAVQYPANTSTSYMYSFRPTLNVTKMAANYFGGMILNSVMEGKMLVGTLDSTYIDLSTGYGAAISLSLPTNNSYSVSGATPLKNYVKVNTFIGSNIPSAIIKVGPGADNIIDLVGNGSTAIDGNVEISSGSVNNTLKGGVFKTGFTCYGGELKCEGTECGTISGNFTSMVGGRISVKNRNNVAGSHYINSNGRVFVSATDQRHTASGFSWKATLTGVVNAARGGEVPIAKIAVNANTLVTCSIWVYRSNTDVDGRLFVRGGQIAGVDNDVTSSATTTSGSWEQVTLTFTPTETGVVEVLMQAWNNAAGTNNVWFDDFTVTQA